MSSAFPLCAGRDAMVQTDVENFVPTELRRMISIPSRTAKTRKYFGAGYEQEIFPHRSHNLLPFRL